MSESITTRRQVHPRVIENFILIWLNVQSNEFEETSLDQLRQIINSIGTFSDTEQCLECLSHIQDEKIFLIISHALDPKVLSLLESISPLQSIYFFSDKTIDYPLSKKSKGLYNQMNLICKELKSDVEQCQSDLTAISILTSSALQNIDELDQSFVYSQLIKEILLQMNYDEKAKNQFLEFCRIQYAENRSELPIINEFERDYRQSSSIWWFTRDCFIPMMLNKALRIQDTEVIIKMGFFIRDLHEQIDQFYSKMDQRQSLTVYRGQGLSNNQFEKLLKSKGGLLSFNNFLSTNSDRQISLNFAKQSLKNADLTFVLFEMKINPSPSSNPFTPLDKFSYFPDRKNEILFSLHTIFRINEIQQIEDRLWQVDLTLASDTDQELVQLTHYIHKSVRVETGIQRIAKLMFVLGKLDQAKEIYTALLETTAENDQKELAHLHHQLGLTNEEKDDFKNALSHYYQSLNIYLSYLPMYDPQLCPAYSSIGLVLKKLANFDGALEYLHHALDIGLIAPNPDQSEIAIRYNHIGGVLDAQGKPTEALENYEHALEIAQKCLPPRHPLIGVTHHNIALVYHLLKDHSSALTHFIKTLEIDQKSLPADHPSLIMIHTNIAGVLEDLHRYQEAIEHAEKAVCIVQNAFGYDHSYTRMLREYSERLHEKN